MLAFLKKFLSKYILEVVPSVVASVVGAYIVTHYINAKPEDKSTPVPAISATVSDPATKGAKVVAEQAKPTEIKASEPKSSEVKSVDAKSADTKSSDDGKALDRADAGPGSETTASTDAKPELKSEAKADSKVDPKRTLPALRGSVTKDAARDVPARDKVAKPSAPVETASAPAADQPRDINELAQQALDRARVAPEARRPVDVHAVQPQMPQPAVPMQTVAIPPAAPAQVQPLPPPVMVSAPAADEPPPMRTGTVPSHDEARADRPTPPADIPPADIPPMDIQASIKPPRAQNTSVGDDVLSAAKSVFHAVIPQ